MTASAHDSHAAGPLTVIVGAARIPEVHTVGHVHIDDYADVQPVAAYESLSGRPGGNGDGLSIRVMSTFGIDGVLGQQRPQVLRHLPTAAGHPDTNLAVVGEWSGRHLTAEIIEAEREGIHTRHRLTLAPRSRRFLGDVDTTYVTPGVGPELGDVAVQARDAVLRAGGHVTVEAGPGHTALSALHTVGIPPWAPYVRDTEILLVVSCDVPQLDDAWLSHVAEEVRRNGGPNASGNTAFMIALTGVTERVPGIAGRDLDWWETGAGGRSLDELNAGNRLCVLLDRVEKATGAWVRLISTGASTAIDLR